MTLTYRGTRDNNKISGFGCKGKRFAEMTYTDGEEEKFNFIISQLRDAGWKVDDGVEYWACVEVSDRKEFDELNDTWKSLKRMYVC